MKTKRDIDYSMGWNGRTTIPAGTQVIPSDNLPHKNMYWACEWEGISDKAYGWLYGYGFLIEGEDVE
jgi:hypothetical protein